MEIKQLNESIDLSAQFLIAAMFLLALGIYSCVFSFDSKWLILIVATIGSLLNLASSFLALRSLKYLHQSDDE